MCSYVRGYATEQGRLWRERGVQMRVRAIKAYTAVVSWRGRLLSYFFEEYLKSTSRCSVGS
jgi:hypothetical protein